MELIGPSNPTKLVYLSILVLSISFVFVQGISNSYFKFSVEASQGDSQSGSQDGGEGINELPDGSGSGSQITDGLTGGSNQTGSQITDGLTGGSNQTGSQITDGLTGGSNQTLQSQSQMTNQTGSQMTNQNLDQTTNQNASQTTNQNVDQTTNQNVNQTTDQNVNVQTDQNVNVQTKQKLDLLFVEQGATRISVDEQNRIESEDKVLITQHVVLTDPACRTGNVLAGIPNAQDLRILLACQDAIGTVVHTKKLDNGHFVFFLDLDQQFKFLLNDRNNQETAGLLVIEIVPQDQTIPGVFLPADGDRVHVWGTWVTDLVDGWHELQPAWKVIAL